MQPVNQEDNDDFLFADEEDVEEVVAEPQPTWKVMIVDDEPAVHEVTHLAIGQIVFQNKGLSFVDAYSGEEAKRLIVEHPDTALVLLDVVMETDDAGLRVARFIREEAKNHFVRIVLRTGQPGQAPETEIILNYDINDYKEKTELTKQKLLTTVISCLRSYNDMMTIEKNRRQLIENEHILRLAKRSAESANQAKTSFLSKMSHELLTPLNAIIGYSDILQEEAAMAGLDDFVPDIQKISEAGQRLSRLYTCILNISKIEADKLQVSPENFNACELANEVALTTQSQIRQNYNQLQIECTELGMIHTDRNMLYQILCSLLNNAGKFTQRGTVKLSGKRITKEDKEWLKIKVCDTGIGLTIEEMNAIFQPFNQLDNSTTRIHEGAGLGLAIAENYTEVLGGTISVESVKGEGSTFILEIPTNILDGL